MSLRKKQFYMIIVCLLVIAGIFVGLRDESESAGNVISSSKTPVNSDLSVLMNSMQIRQFRGQRELPDFDLMSLDGNRVQLSQYKGKVVLVAFWATW
ncbi:MAG: hypothetical protein BMS9Abin21_167 [Thermodesulfovibrionia bacterium]|nr:MAG: hypothetical protein BMS9Abin21_167 [Thermodesulfovibrionia bacterium]